MFFWVSLKMVCYSLKVKKCILFFTAVTVSQKVESCLWNIEDYPSKVNDSGLNKKKKKITEL